MTAFLYVVIAIATVGLAASIIGAACHPNRLDRIAHLLGAARHGFILGWAAVLLNGLGV